MLRTFATAAAFCLAALPVWADLSPDETALIEALGIPEIVEVMAEEGTAYGADLEAQLFPGKGGARWAAIVRQVYDATVMQETVSREMAAALKGTDLDPLIEFFESERGRTIISFEISARQALTEPDIEAAANERLAQMRADEDPRIDQLERFVDVNDLIGSNLMGALNSNFAFYLGLNDGNALPDQLTESEMLATIWAQEDEVRRETELWVYSYLAMAYQPLSDEDVEAYIELSETREGQALNRALFEAFDDMYTGISRALGQAASRFIVGEDI
jgi:hypothetical protein